jgi:MFS family permease
MKHSHPVIVRAMGIRTGALAHRNFRWYFFGNLISMIGWWMHQVAQPWLVLELSDSAFYVGLVAALGFLPITLFSLLGGVVADRYPKRRVILVTQTLFMFVTLGLAVVTLAHVVVLGHVMVAAAMIGLIAAFDIPGRQSFIVDLVGKADLMNAIALNSSVFNASRVFGPAVGGVLIATVGVGLCFLANSVSYLALLAALVVIRVPEATEAPVRISTMSTIREGLAYIAGHQVSRTLVVMLSLASVFGFSFNVLMPVWAREELGLGAKAYGWMVSASGLGALIGGLGLATFARRLPKGKVVMGAGLAFGIVLIAMGRARYFPLVLGLLVLAGLTMVALTATINTLLQTTAPDALRGRVMSVYTLAFAGLLPFGAVLAGAVGERFAPSTFFMGGGAICMIAAATTLRGVVGEP